MYMHVQSQIYVFWGNALCIDHSKQEKSFIFMNIRHDVESTDIDNEDSWKQRAAEKIEHNNWLLLASLSDHIYR